MRVVDCRDLERADNLDWILGSREVGIYVWKECEPGVVIRYSKQILISGFRKLKGAEG